MARGLGVSADLQRRGLTMKAPKVAAEEWGWEQTGPAWGTRVYAPKSGQDHLGLGSVSSDRILPRVSPGINVLTIHPRYWSFYSWVLDDFWATELPRSAKSFRTFFRPREALFAMACHVCDAPEHLSLVANIVGARKVGQIAGGDSFDPQFDYIKQDLGGYGLYYRSTMEATGTIVVARPDNGFPFDAPTAVGSALASAYRRAVSGTNLAETLAGNDVESPVSRDHLVEFARTACLCQLPVASKFDLPLLQDLFLHAGKADEASARSETMRMLLDLSGVGQKSSLSQAEFRQLIYFRTLNDEQYTPRSELRDIARAWRVYQGREYFNYVFNRLLRWLVHNGNTATEGGFTLMSRAKLHAMVAKALNESVEEPSNGTRIPDCDATTTTPELLGALREHMALASPADSVWSRASGLGPRRAFASHRLRRRQGRFGAHTTRATRAHSAPKRKIRSPCADCQF